MAPGIPVLRVAVPRQQDADGAARLGWRGEELALSVGLAAGWDPPAGCCATHQPRAPHGQPDARPPPSHRLQRCPLWARPLSPCLLAPTGHRLCIPDTLLTNSECILNPRYAFYMSK